MAENLLILDREQKQSFERDGCLLLEGFYSAEEMAVMRSRFGDLVTRRDGRPRNMSYSLMEAPEGFVPDPFNPDNVVGMMDQTLADDYWFDQFTEPRIVSVIVDLLGPDIDFHNGKVRNKPPGYECTQGWHQDWPYELHTEPDLAAAITYRESRILANENSGLDGLAEPDLIGQQDPRDRSISDFVGDIDLMRDQTDTAANKAAD